MLDIYDTETKETGRKPAGEEIEPAGEKDAAPGERGEQQRAKEDNGVWWTAVGR